MPDDRLECFGMRGDGLGIYRRNDRADVGDLRRVAAVTAENTEHLGADRLRVTNGGDQIRADVPLDAAAADG